MTHGRSKDDLPVPFEEIEPTDLIESDVDDDDDDDDAVAEYEALLEAISASKDEHTEVDHMTLEDFRELFK